MKKITNSKKIEKLEVLTDSGWKNISAIHTTIKYDIYILKTENFELHCADNHIVFNDNYEEIYVKNLKIDDYIYTVNGLEKILEVYNTGVEDIMYDLELNDENHRYYTNGILSHNTSYIGIIAESFDTLKINCSSKDGRGIDVSEIIEEHCKNYSIPFKKKGRKKGDPNGIKLVWLEEFDNSTPDMRKALRAFIEDNSNVRFVATVNNITKLERTEEDKALISRFNIISFDAENKEEIDYLKQHQLNYLKSICRAIKLEVSDDVLMSLITRKFPNFRATVQLLQEIYISGDLDTYLKKKDTINIDIYTFILNKENNLNENFFYVADNFPKEKTEDLLRTLSRPFFKYLMENHEDIILKHGFKLLDLSKTFNAEYTITIDPEMHLVDYITKLKQILNS